MSRDFDVIVVGAGAAGLSAALAAKNSGASTLLVDADTQLGGSSRLSGGHFYAANTRIQAEAGITDSADAMFEHYMTLNQWLVEPSVVRTFCDRSADTLHWLQDLGVRFPVEDLYPSGVGSTPRGHRPDGAGEEVVNVLAGHCSTQGVETLLAARVSELLAEDDAITGIRIGDDSATSHAVILTTGGFGANQAMLETYYPRATAAGNWSWYIGSPHAQGDGLKLGQAIGADIAGHNRGLLLATPGFSRDLEVGLPPWIIMVNPKGQRFCDENAPYTVIAGLLEHQGGPCYGIFDHEALQNAAPSPVSQAYWVKDTLEQRIADGTVVEGASVAELAHKLELPAAALQTTLDTYNASCGNGADSQFFKKGALVPIVQPPFYAAEIRAAIICWTGTGLRIDGTTHVIKEDGHVIPGLYAAGETVGSLHGDRYVGGGGSFGPCVVFGKLAGEQAAAFAAAQR